MRENELVYKFKPYIINACMSDNFLRELNPPMIHVHMESMFNQTRLGARFEIATRELIKHRWPATWWDAVKDRWYPAWAKQRWPVHYRQIELDELMALKLNTSDRYPVLYRSTFSYLGGEYYD